MHLKMALIEQQHQRFAAKQGDARVGRNTKQTRYVKGGVFLVVNAVSSIAATNGRAAQDSRKSSRDALLLRLLFSAALRAEVANWPVRLSYRSSKLQLTRLYYAYYELTT